MTCGRGCLPDRQGSPPACRQQLPDAPASPANRTAGHRTPSTRRRGRRPARSCGNLVGRQVFRAPRDERGGPARGSRWGIVLVRMKRSMTSTASSRRRGLPGKMQTTPPRSRSLLAMSTETPGLAPVHDRTCCSPFIVETGVTTTALIPLSIRTRGSPSPTSGG